MAGLLDTPKRIYKSLMDAISTGAEMYGSASQPAPPEVVKGVLGFTPVAGDAISAYDAYDAAKQGNYGEAALNSVGLLPFVPSLGGVIKSVGALPKNSTYPKELAGLVRRGLGGLPESKTWDVAGNVFADMAANVRPMTDGDYIVSALPPWGRKNKPFYAVGDDPEELASYALDRLSRGDKSIQAAADNTLLGRLKKQFGDDAFQLGKSTQSKSQYITHIPSGTKIRISDHDLPLHYEQPDVDLRMSMTKDDQLAEIIKALRTNE